MKFDLRSSIEAARKNELGSEEDVLLILYDGHIFAKLIGWALITDDGEAIEGVALEGVKVMWRVIFFFNRPRSETLGPF